MTFDPRPEFHKPLPVLSTFVSCIVLGFGLAAGAVAAIAFVGHIH